MAISTGWCHELCNNAAWSIFKPQDIQCNMKILIRACKQTDMVFIKHNLRILKGIKFKKILNHDLAAAQPLSKSGGD